MTIHIVLNPTAGSAKGRELVDTDIIPLLEKQNRSYETHVTRSERDGVRIGAEIASIGGSHSDPNREVIIVGGDGTAHEVIEGICSRQVADGPSYNLTIIPAGTANALYSSLYPKQNGDKSTANPALRSLEALLSNTSSTLRPLSISSLTLIDTNGQESAPIPSHVVLSTALHANLLKTAEELRSTIPGVERFKVAGGQNISVLHSAKVRLLPSIKGGVRRYNPYSRSYQPTPTTYASDDSGHVTIGGPFAYFLATTTVDRLEPNPPFLISPLVSRIPRDEDEMDVVILRPGRDPIFASKARGGGTRDTALKDGDISTEEWDSSSDDVKAAAIEAWPSRAMAAVTQAYKGGTHIDLVYPTESSEGGRLGPASLVPEQGAGEGGREDDKGEKGEPVVEVLRCGGWEWTPTNPEHVPSHTVCADGSLHIIPPGGTARVKVGNSGEKNGPSFFVHV